MVTHGRAAWSSPALSHLKSHPRREAGPESRGSDEAFSEDGQPGRQTEFHDLFSA